MAWVWQPDTYVIVFETVVSFEWKYVDSFKEYLFTENYKDRRVNNVISALNLAANN